MNLHVWRFKNSNLVIYGKAAISIVLLSTLVLAKLGFIKGDMFILVFSFFIASTAIDLMHIFLIFANSYRTTKDSLIIHDSFHKMILDVGDISTIIVTNNLFAGSSIYTQKKKNRRGDRVCIPYLALYKEAVRNADLVEVDFPLSNGYLENELQKHDIDNDMIFGLLYSKDVGNLFVKKFKGKVYIARTVFENYKEEIAEIYSKWEYKDKSISIIQDRNAKGSFCNSPYLTLE